MPAPSLLDRLAELTDPRSRHGRQYPLVPLVALARFSLSRLFPSAVMKSVA